MDLHGRLCMNEEKGMVIEMEQNKKLDEAELNDASGGGSGLALCLYELGWDTLSGTMNVRRAGAGYETECSATGKPGCTPVACRCWGTSHCKDGWHTCNEDGSPIRFHGITI